MRKYLIPLFALVLFASIFCQKKIDIEKEKEAIKSVIKEEIAVYLDRDYIRQSDTWKKENYVMKVENFGNYHDQIVGWDSIHEGHIKESEKDWSDYTNVRSESKNFNIKVYGKVAWAVFYQQWTGENKGVPYDVTQSRVYFLEKVNDNWKIVLMTMTLLDPCETEEDDDDDDNDDD